MLANLRVGGSLFYEEKRDYVQRTILTATTPAVQLILAQLVLGVFGSASVGENRVGDIQSKLTYGLLMGF